MSNNVRLMSRLLLLLSRYVCVSRMNACFCKMLKKWMRRMDGLFDLKTVILRELICCWDSQLGNMHISYNISLTSENGRVFTDDVFCLHSLRKRFAIDYYCYYLSAQNKNPAIEMIASCMSNWKRYKQHKFGDFLQKKTKNKKENLLRMVILKRSGFERFLFN